MPELSRFFGIVISMYYDDHPPPHFHVKYGSQRARFAIDDVRILDGHVSPRVRGLVVEWASIHQQELRQAWDLARQHQPPVSIAPLE